MTYAYAIHLTGMGEETIWGFNDPAIAAWIDEPVTFPDGVTTLHIPVPGSDETAQVTSGSWWNDKLLHADLMDGVEPLGRRDGYRALADLDDEHLYEGMIY